MPSFGDIPIPSEPSEHLEIGVPDNWTVADPEHRKQLCRELERIEEALGYKGIDLERRKRLCRDLGLISEIYFGPFARTPEVRAGNVDRALAVLRRHAEALQAHLWWGAPRKIESFKEGLDWLKQPLDEPPPPPDDGLSELDSWAMFYIGSEILPQETHRALLDGLAELIAAVDAMKEALPEDRGGRPPNRQLRCMIKGLADYYAQHTGREVGISRDSSNGNPSGPFFRFVSTVLRVFVPDQVRSDNALYSEIKRTLKIKDWRWGLPLPLGSALKTKTPFRG
jgi:hypothetical protein